MKTEGHGDWTSLTVIGDIDDYTYPLFQHELEMLERLALPNLFVDLRGCPFINFKAIKLMVETHAHFDEKGRRIAFQLPGEQKNIRELMELMVAQMGARSLNLPEPATTGDPNP